MRITVSELAEKLGLPCKGGEVELSGVNTLEKATPGQLSFLVNPKYSHLLETTQASCILTQEKHAQDLPCAIISDNVYMDLAKVVHLFDNPQGCLEGQSELAYIHPDAKIDESAVIYPFAFIGEGARVGAGVKIFSGVYVGENTVVGDDCILYPNAVVMGGISLGDGVILQPGAVVGSDGYGYAQTPAGHMKIPQIGTVQVGDMVEIGANSAVDRAALDVTTLGRGSKIDNLVQIGHNVEVGENCLLVGQVGIGGSSKVGDNTILAGQVGVADNVSIGKDVVIGAQAGVGSSVPDGAKMSGSPAMPYNVFLKSMGVCAPKLPELFKRVKKLEKQLADLEKNGDSSDD